LQELLDRLNKKELEIIDLNNKILKTTTDLSIIGSENQYLAHQLTVKDALINEKLE